MGRYLHTVGRADLPQRGPPDGALQMDVQMGFGQAQQVAHARTLRPSRLRRPTIIRAERQGRGNAWNRTRVRIAEMIKDRLRGPPPIASTGTIAALNWAAGIEATAAFVLIYQSAARLAAGPRCPVDRPAVQEESTCPTASSASRMGSASKASRVPSSSTTSRTT
ncbi:hypothetical protein GCM10009736_13970 [Actinomadura bangladeshensis]